MVAPHADNYTSVGLGADTPGILQRTAELIPDRLKFSATFNATPELLCR